MNGWRQFCKKFNCHEDVFFVWVVGRGGVGGIRSLFYGWRPY